MTNSTFITPNNESDSLEQDHTPRVPDRIVLCVDLDGTLLSTDTLLESLILLLKQQPWLLLLLPFWALKGKAFFKHQISLRTSLAVPSLPYREDILTFLNREYSQGRTLVLVTGADEKIAKQIGEYIGVFSEIIASDGKTNVVGGVKCQILEARYGFRGFDYIGNDSIDLKIWASANEALVVSSSPKLIRNVENITTVQRTFSPPTSPWPALFKEIRVYQWIKNILIFLPLATAHRFFEFSELLQAGLAFMAFSFCASSFYIFNDLMDLSADRRHPKKRFRPFASGTLSLKAGFLLQPLLLALAFLISLLFLPLTFSYLLGGYALATMTYSFYLKKTAILDVIALASLYALRILAGGVAVGISISSWLLAFSLFFFMSLAIGKRYAELQFRKVSAFQGIERRAYVGADKDILGTMGVISGYMSALVLALYINSQEVSILYTTPRMAMVTLPIAFVLDE